MFKKSIFALLLSLSLSFPAMAERLNYLWIGQSNACDRGVASELPTYANASKMFVYNKTIPYVADQPGTWSLATAVIDPTGAVAGSAGAAALAFADRMAALTGKEIGIVPNCYGGTTITDWRKWNRDNGLYGMALQRAWWAEDQGHMAGVVWIQGEADSVTVANAQYYSERQGRLFSDIRVDLANLQLPIVYVKLNDTFATLSAYPGASTIRQQQDWVTMNKVGMINVDDLPMLSDKTHYPTASYTEMGIRLADEMFAQQ